jgi:hypothetical protein
LEPEGKARSWLGRESDEGDHAIGGIAQQLSQIAAMHPERYICGVIDFVERFRGHASSIAEAPMAWG